MLSSVGSEGKLNYVVHAASKVFIEAGVQEASFAARPS